MAAAEPAWTHSLKVQLTEPEFIAAQRALQRLSYRSPRLIRVWLVLWIVYSIIAYQSAWIDDRPVNIMLSLAVGLGVGMTVMVLSFAAILYFSRFPFAARRLWRQNRNLHVEHQFSWNERTMEWRSERSFVRMEWEEFVRWFELPDAFILMQTDRSMHIVVKRVLTPAEEESIRTALRSAGVPLGWRKRASA